MFRVNGDAMIFVLTTSHNKGPAAFLLLKIKTRCVREENDGKDETRKAKPGNEVELLLIAYVIVNDGGEEGATLANSGGETVGCGTDRGWVNFSCDKVTQLGPNWLKNEERKYMVWNDPMCPCSV
jgi:hypothetical protein